MAGHGSPSKPSPDVGITPLTSREPEGSMFGTGSRLGSPVVGTRYPRPGRPARAKEGY